MTNLKKEGDLGIEMADSVPDDRENGDLGTGGDPYSVPSLEERRQSIHPGEQRDELIHYEIDA